MIATAIEIKTVDNKQESIENARDIVLQRATKIGDTVAIFFWAIRVNQWMARNQHENVFKMP